MTAAASGSAREELLERVVAWFTVHGVADTSMRTLATGIGTSNRMLNYHFGARENLLAAVIERVCAAEDQALRAFIAASSEPVAAGVAYWQHAVTTARTFAPLFYEMSAHAMYGKTYAERLRSTVASAWVAAFTDSFARVVAPQEARRLAHLSLAVGRGVLFELALTGDDGTAENTIATFTEILRESIERGADGGQPKD